MSRTAVLLMDLQVDFLDTHKGRMPVEKAGAARVIAAANSVLLSNAFPGVVVVAIVNAFPRSQRISNFFRHHAAVSGSAGAQLDQRVSLPPGTPIFSKACADAFSNASLHTYLQSCAVTRVCIIGVFAEGCVRATALAARKLGYDVCVPLDAIATNASWKLRFATHSMRSHGVSLVAHLSDVCKAA
jgi:nicotinamidase-related amidase